MSNKPLVIIGQGDYARRVLEEDIRSSRGYSPHADGQPSHVIDHAKAQAELAIDDVTMLAREINPAAREMYWRLLYAECMRHLPKGVQAPPEVMPQSPAGERLRVKRAMSKLDTVKHTLQVRRAKAGHTQRRTAEARSGGKEAAGDRTEAATDTDAQSG